MIGEGRSVFFLINLVQDVNILRPLVHLAKRETAAYIGLLVSDAFIKRDRQKIWQREVAGLAAETGHFALPNLLPNSQQLIRQFRTPSRLPSLSKLGMALGPNA